MPPRRDGLLDLPGGPGARGRTNPPFGNLPPGNSNGNNQGVPVDLTIDAQVQKITTGYPATDLIFRFLKLVGTNIGPVPRDAHTLAQVFFRARSVYDGILALVKQLENSPTMDNPSWIAFDSYTVAIPELEQFLFTFFQGYCIDKPRGLLPPSDSTGSAILHIETWRKDREFLNTTFEDLKKKPFSNLSQEVEKHLIANHAVERTKDDIAILQALSQFLNKSPLSDKDVEHATVQDTVKTLKEDAVQLGTRLLRRPPAEAQLSIAIRALMYIYIPYALIPLDVTDSQWKVYLGQALIWEKMNRMMAKVKTYIEPANGQVVSLDELEKEFSEIEKLLLNLGNAEIDTNKEVMSLFRLAAGIHRQYHSRSVALIRTLYYLDTQSRRPEVAGVVAVRHELKRIMTDSIDTLQSMKNMVLDLSAFTVDSNDYHEHASGLEELFGMSEKFFTPFMVQHAFPKYEATYKAAVKLDEDHMRKAKEILKL